MRRLIGILRTSAIERTNSAQVLQNAAGLRIEQAKEMNGGRWRRVDRQRLVHAASPPPADRIVKCEFPARILEAF